MAALFAIIFGVGNKIGIFDEKLGKEFICTYANKDINGKLVGQSRKQIMLYDKNKIWTILDRENFKEHCSVIPVPGLEMLSGYNHLSGNFTK